MIVRSERAATRTRSGGVIFGHHEQSQDQIIGGCSCLDISHQMFRQIKCLPRDNLVGVLAGGILNFEWVVDY